MKNLKKITQAKLRNLALKGTFAVSGLVASAASYAAIDLTNVQAGITAAETSALTTGEYVIGTVASLVVVGLIIALVKKI